MFDVIDVKGHSRLNFKILTLTKNLTKKTGHNLGNVKQPSEGPTLEERRINVNYRSLALKLIKFFLPGTFGTTMNYVH